VNMQIRARLGAMMFLEYFIWGAWYVTVGTMIAPFFVGLIADKLFATQRVLAGLHLLGGILLLLASKQAAFPGVYAFLLLYCLCFMPTLALTNSLAFRQMSDPKLEFGPIRVLGTAGWIAAGLLVGTLRLEATARPLQLAAALSILMAIYCLTLPDTPPLAREGRFTLSSIFPREAISHLRERSMAVFAIASFLICIPLQFYYAFTNLFLNESGVHNAAGKMTGGQMSELFCMLLIPWFFRRLGVKYMLVAGMSAWVLRYLFFAYGNADGRVWMFWLGILLHGICYDFFFVTGQIYIDRKASLALRAAAQGLITFITYGAGMFVGSWLSGAVVERYTTTSTTGATIHEWQSIWLVAAAASAVVLVLFLVTFTDKQDVVVTATESAGAIPIESPL
jgi:nucleoside transporter